MLAGILLLRYAAAMLNGVLFGCFFAGEGIERCSNRSEKQQTGFCSGEGLVATRETRPCLGFLCFIKEYQSYISGMLLSCCLLLDLCSLFSRS
jgi:hypothetical protein